MVFSEYLEGEGLNPKMMEVQQQHSPVGVGPLDFSRRGVAEASAFRVVKPKQPSPLIHQQSLLSETNNNENLQENPQIPSEIDGEHIFQIRFLLPESEIVKTHWFRVENNCFECYKSSR